MLHEWRIEDREYRRHEARRGRRHAFEQLDPTRTALVVVDMVRFHVADNPFARGIVVNIACLADAVRGAGGVVAWLLPANVTPTATQIELFGPDIAGATAGRQERARSRARVWPELEVGPDDLVVEKTAPGGFFPGRSALPRLLEARGIDTVLVTGTVANVCCESTARDASTLGYRVVMVADANAALARRGPQRDVAHDLSQLRRRPADRRDPRPRRRRSNRGRTPPVARLTWSRPRRATRR